MLIILISPLKAVIGDRVAPKGHIHHPGRELYVNLLKDLWTGWVDIGKSQKKKWVHNFPFSHLCLTLSVRVSFKPQVRPNPL